MNYGFEDRPGPVVLAASIIFGVILGAAAGAAAFLIATALAHLLYDALPGMSLSWRVVTYAVPLSLPMFAFSRPIRNSRSTTGARVMAWSAALVLVCLVAGELTGVLQIYPSQFHFFIAPGPPA